MNLATMLTGSSFKEEIREIYEISNKIGDQGFELVLNNGEVIQMFKVTPPKL